MTGEELQIILRLSHFNYFFDEFDKVLGVFLNECEDPLEERKL